MLGSDVAAECARRGWTVIAPSEADFDIADPMAAAALASGQYGPIDWVVNSAAYTAVDKAEEERDVAMRVNGLAPSYLSRAASAIRARFLHISTDFVFDGTKTESYEPDDATNPLGSYGESKLLGEDGALAGSMDAIVVRTSWLFGPNGGSFPRTMINAFRAGKNLKVVADQIGTPTYTGDLARTIADVAERGIPGGIYHAAGPDVLSWHEFAQRAISSWIELTGEGEAPEIIPIMTEDWPTPAKRPAYSALSTKKLNDAGIEPMRPLDQTLPEFCRRLRELET